MRVFYVLFLAFLLSFPVSSQPNPPPPSTVNSRTEQLQQQINQLQTELKAIQNDRTDHNNLIVLTKGLTDLENRVEDLGIYIALFGILITVMIIFFALRTSRESIAQAVQEVRIRLNKATKPIKVSLQNEGTKILDNIRQQGNESLKKIEVDANQQIKELLERIEFNQGKLDQDDITKLRRLADLIRQKSEDQYSFENWRTLYLEAGKRKAFDKKDTKHVQEIEKYVQKMEHTAANDWETTLAKSGRAWLLANLEKYAEAIKLFDEIIAGCDAASDDPSVIERIVATLYDKGYSLEEKGDHEAAIAVFDDIVSRYGSRSEASIALQVARALYYKGYSLDPGEAAIAVFDDIVSRYSARSEAGIAVLVARALYAKGTALGEGEAAIAVFDDIVSRYSSRSEAGIAVLVARALYAKSTALGEGEEAIAVYDDIVSRYGTRSEVGITIEVAKAQSNRADTLRQLNRTFEAKVAYASIIARYASRTESEILKLVEKANNAINELGNV